MSMYSSRLAKALSSRDFRLYSGAQFLHGLGVWMHRIAELWLVYEITGAALSVGFATAARAGSSVVLAPLAGMLADRSDRRRMLIGTQIAKAAVAGGLAAVVFAVDSDIPLGLMYSVIAALGVISAIDIPLRRAFVRDVVSADGLEGAARLHTPVMAVGRISGSALAALLLALSVPWACFALNAAVSVAAALLVLGVSPSAGASSRSLASEAGGEDGHLLVHLRRTPAVTVPLVLLLCFSLFGWNVDVLIPVLVDNQLHAGPEAFGMLVSVMSFGILCGSLTAAVRGRSGPRTAQRPARRFRHSAGPVGCGRSHPRGAGGILADRRMRRRILEPRQLIRANSR